MYVERTGKTWYRLGNVNLDVTRPSERPVPTKVVKGKECVPDLRNPELDQITFLLYPREVNCTLKGLERPGIDSGMSFWMSHVRLRGSVTTKVVKGKECVPDLRNPELDQITFLLYPNEVNCTLKGLERPGIDSGMSI